MLARRDFGFERRAGTEPALELVAVLAFEAVNDHGTPSSGERIGPKQAFRKRSKRDLIPRHQITL
jgi:hypothetical protein